MKNSANNFYQGQVISLAISTDNNATQEEKSMLTNNDVYMGIYGQIPTNKNIYSTTDGSLTRTIKDDGSIVFACVIPASKTKIMNGLYNVELLIKNKDNSFTAPCDNTISFNIERRRISEVI